LKRVNPIQGIIYCNYKWSTNQATNVTLIQHVSKDVTNLQTVNTIKISPAALFCTEVHSVQQISPAALFCTEVHSVQQLSPAALFCTEVHSVQQISEGLKFSKCLSGSDLKYSCHHNSSRFTFQIFVRSWRFSVLHSLQTITPSIC